MDWFDGMLAEFRALRREHRELCWKDQDPIAHDAWRRRDELVPAIVQQGNDLIVHPALLATFETQFPKAEGPTSLLSLLAPRVIVSVYCTRRRGSPDPPAWVVG